MPLLTFAVSDQVILLSWAPCAWSLALLSGTSVVQSDKKANNAMREMRVAKLVLNCCVGESGDRLQKAAKVMVKQPK